MADIELVLSAGVKVEVPVTGRYYRVTKGNGNIWIGVDNGAVSLRQRGMGQSVSAGFTTLQILSAMNQTIRIAIEMDRVDDSRLSLDAPISVIDESETKSKAGSTYEMWWGGNAFTNYRRGAFLHNPSTTIRCVVRQIIVSSQSGCRVDVSGDTGLPSWVFGPYPGDSKLVGSGSSTAVAYDYKNASGAPGNYLYRRFTVGPNSTVSMVVEYPWVLNSDVYLCVNTVLQNEDLIVVFEWDEYS